MASRCQIIDIENTDKSDKELWEEYREKYKKDYTPQELEFRFQVFLKNIRLLKDEPTFEGPDGKVLLGSSFSPFSSARMVVRKSYRKGVNQFIDLTE